ncbi:MAG TPA: helicase-related protein [Anaerolineaceae bacterium]|nr:helicase-related protein [Anaerolineaceae bacterium]
MPRIFDNIALHLLPDLREALNASYRADFCVGYFNLRGWNEIGEHIDSWTGCDGQCVRLLVGMQRLPQDELRTYYQFIKSEGELDNSTKLRLKKKLAEEFRNQLTIGAPSNQDEVSLRRLASQIRAGKVVVKLFLQHPLHAKLYLLFRNDTFNPIIGYVGSSNLTLAGLSAQGELNVDVLDSDASQKLSKWFDDRWDDWGTVDISEELAKIIEESWAREETIPPYQIYIKMAYHLSQEARAGLNEFRIPKDFGNRLFAFQTAAVKIAAHHLNKRGGVLIGDVVGLGKTLMATAVARIFEDDQDFETLILCPKNLVSMWEKYQEQYRMRAKVVSVSRVQQVLPNLKRYRMVILDESHNLRNREGKRYKIIREYIDKNECRCILLSATPYNKTYLDLSNQLRLFVPEDKELGVKPEKLLRELGETEFIRKFQCSPRTLAAFEKSEFADDWRELMRLYMVRRTRSFIIQNYAELDPDSGRRFLTLDDGSRSYFPTRFPKTVKFEVNDADPNDQYARLYSDDIVDTINNLNLPRYGLGNYINERIVNQASKSEKEILDNLSRAGKRLMGFCRTNLFKRMESSGEVFLESVQRHILRNYIFLHALENNLPLPIGTQDVGLLDTRLNDADIEDTNFFDIPNEDELPEEMVDETLAGNFVSGVRTENDYQKKAKEIYDSYARTYKKRFDWLSSGFFSPSLKKHLREDAQNLIQVLEQCHEWNWRKDTKFLKLLDLVNKTHSDKKIIIFTQFADTVRYLEKCLKDSGVTHLAGVEGSADDPTSFALRFSPIANEVEKQIRPEQVLRVLVATDVLSEGQNLQDGYIVVNYDLPWAIVRLIQRAGRVDRIGQKSDEILCYSFLPAEGVEKIIRLRARVRKRLKENAEVVGTDEAFFEDDLNDRVVADLYNEKAGILDGDDDTEVDLSSYAYQIWNNAITQNPGLRKTIEELPALVFSTKEHVSAPPRNPNGVLVYARTGEGNDSLAWVDQNGNNVTESQLEILRAAECTPDTPAIPRQENHHDLVRKGVELILTNEKSTGGQLGRPSGARFRVYERLKRFADENKGTLFVSQELLKTIDDIYRFPLREGAKDTLNRLLRSGIQDFQLAELVVTLRSEDRLCIITEEQEEKDPQIICSLGLSNK